jgi:integrase
LFQPVHQGYLHKARDFLVAKEHMAKRAFGEGALLKRKGCRFWVAQFYKDGRQIRISTRTEVKQKALVILRKHMGDVERGLAPVSDLKKISYGNLRAGLLASYVEEGNKSLEVRADGTETIGGLKALDEFFGFSATSEGVAATRLTTDAARQFAQVREDAGFSAATINRSLACLRRMLKIARDDGKIQAVPVIRLRKEPPARRGFLKVDAFEKLVAKLPAHLHALVIFLYWGGGRLGEAKSIEWPQVDLVRRIIRLESEQTKTDEARVVPLPPVLVEMLSAVKPKVGRVFDSTNLRTEWATACTAAGLGTMEEVVSASGFKWKKYSGLIVHDLRRSAIRNLVNAGVPERIAMKISGHKTRAVFDRYHIVSDEDVVNAMERLVKVSGKSVARKPRTARKLLGA